MRFLNRVTCDPRIPKMRKSSAPFLSGDSFMHISDHVFLREFDLAYLNSLLAKVQKEIETKRQTLFIEVSALERNEVAEKILNWAADSSKYNFSNLNLLIHNGDRIPQKSFFDFLIRCGLNVYSVNTTEENSGVKPLPIGLENRHLKANGVGRRYKIQQEEIFRVNRSTGHKNDLFASFNVATNTSERSKAKIDILKYGYIFTEPKLTTKKYQRCVNNSRFVVSPPGNGIDCHRTWEAIYLGAIPIVLKQCLSKELINLFPIIAVSEWGEFIEIGSREREELVLQFDGRKFPAMSIEYWRCLLNSPGE
jgi:hypothetical protein